MTRHLLLVPFVLILAIDLQTPLTRRTDSAARICKTHNKVFMVCFRGR